MDQGSTKEPLLPVFLAIPDICLVKICHHNPSHIQHHEMCSSQQRERERTHGPLQGCMTPSESEHLPKCREQVRVFDATFSERRNIQFFSLYYMYYIVYRHTHTSVYIHVHTYKYNTNIHTYLQAFVTHTHTRKHTQTHAHTHIHIYI